MGFMVGVGANNDRGWSKNNAHWRATRGNASEGLLVKKKLMGTKNLLLTPASAPPAGFSKSTNLLYPAFSSEEWYTSEYRRSQSEVILSIFWPPISSSTSRTNCSAGKKDSAVSCLVSTTSRNRVESKSPFLGIVTWGTNEGNA